jgi:hypothetical protein
MQKRKLCRGQGVVPAFTVEACSIAAASYVIAASVTGGGIL